MSPRIDHEEAESLLRETWREVNEEDQESYLEDAGLKSSIRSIVHTEEYGTKTFKYMLVTNVLAKAVNPDVHYRALKEGGDLPGSFNSGGMATEVVTEWEKDHGQRLGGSNEPRTNKPYFDQSEVQPDYDAANQAAYDRLYQTLERLQELTESGEISPKSVLKQTLLEVSRLDSTMVDYENPPDVPCSDLLEAVEGYLGTSNLGERLTAVTAGVIDAQYFHAGRDSVRIEAHHVNVSDRKSDAAGDVEVFDADGDDAALIGAIEVKDKPATKSDVQHSVAAARRHELDEYKFVLGKGFRSDDERRRAESEIEEAPIEVVLIEVEELLGSLKFHGRAGRSRFREAVGEYLNEMRAQPETKAAWKRLIESFDEL